MNRLISYLPDFFLLIKDTELAGAVTAITPWCPHFRRQDHEIAPSNPISEQSYGFFLIFFVLAYLRLIYLELYI